MRDTMVSTWVHPGYTPAIPASVTPGVTAPAKDAKCAPLMHNLEPYVPSAHESLAGQGHRRSGLHEMEFRVTDRSQKVRAPASVPSTRACDNPECGRRLKWSMGRGRPPLYCTPNCRKRAVSVAGKLNRAVQAQQRQLHAGGLTYRAERQVRTELARLEWLLSMYPPSALPGTTTETSDVP